MPVAPIIPYRSVLGKGKQPPAEDMRSPLNRRTYRVGGLSCRPALAGPVPATAGICSGRRYAGDSDAVQSQASGGRQQRQPWAFNLCGDHD
jgi:hypothetical protein